MDSLPDKARAKVQEWLRMRNGDTVERKQKDAHWKRNTQAAKLALNKSRYDRLDTLPFVILTWLSFPRLAIALHLKFAPPLPSQKK